jgi:Ser/Thr protein kinase RdoA (MazF antagonist)
MLKLRHLVDNRPLAELLREAWDADPDPFAWYRISSNAIYPFTHAGEQRYLRFAPAAEKRAEDIAAELDFLTYLARAGYSAAVPIASRNGDIVVSRDTPWGRYHASAFHAVPGIQLDRTDLGDEVVAAYGRALAELHRLSAAYRPAGPRRCNERDVLAWIRSVLAGLPANGAALDEVDLVAQRLATVPQSTDNYGLIHYDFECDNVFFDAASGRCFAIDFDDAMYHWFTTDIEQALHSLAREVPAELVAAKEAVFLAAYAELRPLPEDFATLRSVCRRFADLYWYARVSDSLAERLPDEPDWMVDLRNRLETRQAECAARFGTPL